MAQAEMEGAPCIQVVGQAGVCEIGFVQGNAQIEFREHVHANRFPQCVQIADIARETFAPDDASGACFDEVDQDRHPGSTHFERAAHAIPHAEQAADFHEVGVRRIEAE
ncbi:MAG TPA: hypothetical protein VFI26_06715 [Lysobacter sp.]|nr:hypothetical protein [Lysobacter sp.]